MIGGFDDSPIRLNECLKKADSWNAEFILKRAAELANKAVKVWNAPNISQNILDKYSNPEDTKVDYDLEHYNLKGEMFELYTALSKRVLNIDSSVKEKYKKQYIAFKSSTNFVDIVPQKSRFLLLLYIDFAEVIDPKGICRDVSELGTWGNGDVEVGISEQAEINYAMELIQQAFDKQLEYI